MTTRTRRTLCLPIALGLLASTCLAAAATTLGIQKTRFTLQGAPTFLLGFSYYAGLGAPDDSLRRDLDDAQQAGFNWLRVWATWNAFDHDVSAVDTNGSPREPFLGRLRTLVAECDLRGLVVDITLTRGRGAGSLPNLAAHQRAVDTLLTALKTHRNWYLDLANERDVRDARYVPIAELKTLRDQARNLDATRIVTASYGGHDLSERDVRQVVIDAGLDFLAPHRPRHPESPAQTEAATRDCLDLLRRLNHPVPVHHQEPFRRGYTDWQPTAEDFLRDLQGAVAGGAAGWCFHNGTQRGAPEEQPRRSFDLRQHRLFEQLDPEERRFIRDAAGSASMGPSPLAPPGSVR